MSTFMALLTLEGKGIRRDSTMLILSAVPIFLLAIFRFGFPPLFGLFGKENLLWENGPFVTTLLLLFAPMMLGMASGYLLLDDRDEDILTYLDITPLRRSGYLRFKSMFPLVISAIYVSIDLAFSGFSTVPFGRAVVVTLVVISEAPMVMFLMVAFAGNKVEGLAVGKALNILNTAPFAVYLLPTPWSWLACIAPSAWVTKMMTAGSTGEFLLLTLGGIGMHGIWLWGTWRLFKRRVG